MPLAKRLTAVYILLLALLSFTVFRLYVLSGGERASQVLSGQYTRRIDVAAHRGLIYDRSGAMLNAREDGFSALVIPTDAQDKKAVIASLSPLCGESESSLTDRFLAGVPFRLRLDSPFDAPGVVCVPRCAPSPQAAIHLVGYTDKSGKGVTGLEKGFDGFLSGEAAGRVSYSYRADPTGKPLARTGSVLTSENYGTGSGVYTTLDLDLQKACEEIAAREMTMGALAVCRIDGGELLASVSLPGFSQADVASLLDSTRGELVNRCAAPFTPGSIFKTVVAAAALEEDLAYYEKEYDCSGAVEADGTRIRCHAQDGHGVLTMKDAYAQSCNTYFIRLALAIGFDKVADMAKRMGVGEEKSLEGVCVYGGRLPEPPFSDVTAANCAVGQGELLVCPYEMLCVFSCAAAGYWDTPRVVGSLRRDGAVIAETKRERHAVLSAPVTEKLREMMGACVEEGLGKEARPNGACAGGKTATAQTGQFRGGKELLHTWFCGVYPLDDPAYAICVLCDGNGDGGNPRAVFRQVCEILQ